MLDFDFRLKFILFTFCIVVVRQYFLYSSIIAEFSSRFDLINKWAYFGSFLIVFHLSYWFILFNFLILMLFIKLMVSIKQMLLISSLITYLFIICLILVNEYLFSFSILSFYSSTIAVLIFHGVAEPRLRASSTFYVLYLLTDLIILKVFIIITSMLLILYWLIVFSFFPTTMFLNKFFSLTVLINYSVSMSFNLTFFSQSLYQVCFLRSCCWLITFYFMFFFTARCYFLELSYFTFQLAFLFSTFFFKAPIHSIELFTGCSSCYCLYHIHYLTSFQYILFFSIWSGIILLIPLFFNRSFNSMILFGCFFNSLFLVCFLFSARYAPLRVATFLSLINFFSIFYLNLPSI